jgi:hypothetical protein
MGANLRTLVIANDLTSAGIRAVWALVITNDLTFAGVSGVWALVITDDPMRERR